MNVDELEAGRRIRRRKLHHFPHGAPEGSDDSTVDMYCGADVGGGGDGAGDGGDGAGAGDGVDDDQLGVLTVRAGHNNKSEAKGAEAEAGVRVGAGLPALLRGEVAEGGMILLYARSWFPRIT